jgi:hypothetical protein
MATLHSMNLNHNENNSHQIPNTFPRYRCKICNFRHSTSTAIQSHQNRSHKCKLLKPEFLRANLETPFLSTIEDTTPTNTITQTINQNEIIEIDVIPDTPIYMHRNNSDLILWKLFRDGNRCMGHSQVYY